MERQISVDMREAFNNYILAIQHLGTSTQKEYRQKLAVFVAWCEAQKLSLEQVNNAAFTSFVAHLKSSHTSHRAVNTSLSSHTIAGYYRVLKAFLNWCCDDDEYCEYVKPVTVKRLKPPKVDEFLIETFTIDHVEALLAATHYEYNDHLQLRDRAMVTLFWQTGIRAGELCTLRIAKTDLQRADPSIRVFGKGQKERRLPLQGDCRKLVKHYIDEYREDAIQKQIAQAREQFRSQRQRNPTDKEYALSVQNIREQATVFVSRYHEPLNVTGVYQIIRRLGEWAGISGVRCSPHTFRHTYAANYMRNGGNIYTLSKLLGHTNVGVTEDYLKTLGVWDLVSHQV